MLSWHQSLGATMKSEIIEQLGQPDLLLPCRIAEGLAANNRVKARLSVLQAAAGHAQNPGGAHFDLTEECRAAGIDPVAMAALANRANQTTNGGRIAAPGLGNLLAAIFDDVTDMARAVEAGDAAQAQSAFARLNSLATATPTSATDEIEPAQIAKLTAISSEAGDSLHRLIMDLHKALNNLAADHAEEVVAGARVYGLLPDDRVAVEAFMHGVEATQKLRFGHPGLATTAARAGTRLTIQNDIGETDAHVVVITVDRDAVAVTYTDVHLPRARFFTGLFKSFAVEWSGLERKSVTGLADDGVFYLITGRYPLGGDTSRDAFLEALGASLVFLIDWNKARKLLRTWVSKNDALEILDWAARHRCGHRGFLELGGSEFLSAAVRHVASNRIGFGEQLDRVLGRNAAVDFLKTVLRVSAEALLQGSSIRLARDRIEADFVRHLQRVDTALLATVIRQAGLAREIATAIGRFLAEHRGSRPLDGAGLAAQARHIEEKADRIAMETRGEIARLDANRGIERLVNHMEDAIDELEQAAFVASVIPAGLAGDLMEPLDELCAAVVNGTEAAAIGAAAAAEVPEGHRVDSEDALAAVGRLIDAEHNGDTAERKVTTNILTGSFDLKTALSAIELARALERATDRLAAFGHALREYVLADLAA
jgi:uncharacterized protein Yka (UPF0111/DUF47 family)